MYVIGDEEVEAVRRVIASGRLFRYDEKGETETDLLEREWAGKIGVEYAIATTSGTASLICALAGLGVGPGDEVIVPGYTFMATALAVLAVGAVPVIAEVDESLTLDPEDMERKTGPRTKAVVPVHMCGLPCDMDAITALARRHELHVVEDACQADGGSYRGRRLGSMGDAGAFSFNFYKIMTAGEGGALVTDRTDVYERAMIQHDGGCAFFSEKARRISVPVFAGWNFRISEILSAIVRVQVTRLDDVLAKLRAEKRIMSATLSRLTEKGAPFRPSPVNDADGDCATTTALLCETGREARAFIERLSREGVGASTPIDSGRHVYTNWEPVMNRAGAHHPGRDPYRLADPPVEYSPDMCPRTLDVLARTVSIPTSATRSEDELREVLEAVKRAARAC